MKRGDLIQLSARSIGYERQDQVKGCGIVVQAQQCEHVTCDRPHWWVLWNDGEYGLESENYIVVINESR